MIDASLSPRAAWRRYATLILLLVLVAAAAYVIWTKELHHSAATNSAPKQPPAVVSTKTHSVRPSATTIPGGVPVSGRDPFQS
jgi:hypothetical protein